MIDKSRIITDEVIDDLMEDWFSRDGDTFTKIRKTGRLGWESTLKEGEAYSSYILESPTQEDLLKRAYSLASETIISMDAPFKIRVKISSGSMSYTDGKVVCVSTKMFDEKVLSNGAKLDAFLGTTVHEGCHLLYTDLSVMRDAKNSAIRTLFNIIEDERVEQLCGDNKPGLANFLEASKYYYFDFLFMDALKEEEKRGELTPFMRIMQLILHIVRFPKYLSEDEIIKYAHYLIEIKKVLLPFPVLTRDAFNAAVEIFDIIKDFYVEEEMKEKSKSKSKDKSGGSGSGGLSDGDGESDSDEETDGGESGSGDEEPTAEDIKKALEKLKRDSEKDSTILDKLGGAPTSLPTSSGGKGGLSPSEVSSTVLKDSGLLGELCEGVVELGSTRDTFFSKMPDEQASYMDSLSRVKRFIPAIARIMKGHSRDYKLIHRGMRSGVLDTTKLAEAFQGVSTVYLREGEVKTDKIAVVVLIDESGSMSGTRIISARDTAVLINEAVGQIPNVELYIYGHSGDIKRSLSTELYVYREKGYTPKYSLGSCRARAQNRDGVAIIEVAKRVRKQSKHPALYFILSDGAPCAGAYSGNSAMEHVRNEVLKTEKLGFSVIQVCINHVYDPSRMFKKFIVLDDMSTLAFELGKVIKKSAMDLAKIHIK